MGARSGAGRQIGDTKRPKAHEEAGQAGSAKEAAKQRVKTTCGAERSRPRSGPKPRAGGKEHAAELQAQTRLEMSPQSQFKSPAATSAQKKNGKLAGGDQLTVCSAFDCQALLS